MATTTLTELEVIQLPFRVSKWDEDGLVALARNFATIEEMMGKLQVYMNTIGFQNINGTSDMFDNIVLRGLEADMPILDERGGHWFYWATDTRKLYLLGSNTVSGSEVIEDPVVVDPEDPEEEIPVTPVIADFNVSDYGAVGDGLTDDTDAINAAIVAANSAGGAKTVGIETGTYLIDIDTSVRVLSNVTLILAADAILKAIPSSTGVNNVVKIQQKTNCGILGGQIIGDKDGHISAGGSSGHEHGMGISILESSNVHIADLSITKCFGDGIYLGNLNVESENYNDTVLIEDFDISYCRRNGITLTSNKNVTIKNGVLSYIDNTDNLALPRSGIEFEPNSHHNWTGVNILIDTVESHHNGKYGIWVCGWYDSASSSPPQPPYHPVSITIQNHNLHDNGVSNYLASDMTLGEDRVINYTA